MAIEPPVPEHMWSAYPNDADLLAALQTMTPRPTELSGDGQLYDFMVTYDPPHLIRDPSTTPPYVETFRDAFDDPNSAPDTVKYLGRLFGFIEEQRPQLPTDSDVQAPKYAAMLEDMRTNGYLTNAQILEIYDFGGGVPWRQLTEQEIADERQRLADEETENQRRQKFDQDLAYLYNEILNPAADTYDRAIFSQALADGLVWWDQQTDP